MRAGGSLGGPVFIPLRLEYVRFPIKVAQTAHQTEAVQEVASVFYMNPHYSQRHEPWYYIASSYRVLTIRYYDLCTYVNRANLEIRISTASVSFPDACCPALSRKCETSLSRAASNGFKIQITKIPNICYRGMADFVLSPGAPGLEGGP